MINLTNELPVFSQLDQDVCPYETKDGPTESEGRVPEGNDGFHNFFTEHLDFFREYFLRLLGKTLNDWQAYSVTDGFSVPPLSVFCLYFTFLFHIFLVFRDIGRVVRERKCATKAGFPASSPNFLSYDQIRTQSGEGYKTGYIVGLPPPPRTSTPCIFNPCASAWATQWIQANTDPSLSSSNLNKVSHKKNYLQLYLIRMSLW